MKRILNILTLLFFAFTTNAQKNDTIFIKATDLQLKRLKPGTTQYLVYFKDSKSSPRKSFQLWTETISFIDHNGTPAISIDQVWEDHDSIVHQAHSVNSKTDFHPLYQQTWWKGFGIMTVDLAGNEMRINDKQLTASDTSRSNQKRLTAFNAATTQYVLNWHTDMQVFEVLPYKKDAIFKINFYDPGLAAPSWQLYTVSGTAILQDGDQQIDCWLLTHGSLPQNLQTFWINKKTGEVLKLEQEYNGKFRYKVRMGIQ